MLRPPILSLRRAASSLCSSTSYLPHVAASVARYAERSEADVRRDTTATAFRLFKLAERFTSG